MLELFTIGYEGQTPDDVVARLKAAGVELVIDARWTPLSRKPGFSKNALASRLAAEGIAYEHHKAVGTLKEFRVDFKLSKDFETFAERYERYLDQHMDAVAAVFERVRARRSALLCFEASPAHCHRLMLARRLEQAFAPAEGLKLTHL